MLLKRRRISLSSSPFYASAAVILALGIFMAIFWAFNEYEAYNESIDNIRKSYQARYRERVSEEVDKVIGFIDYRRSQADLRVENEMRDRVQSAYSIASHMYSRHKDELSQDELKDLVVEVLRPIRWSNNRGYYFAGSVESGIVDLYADDPYFERNYNLPAAGYGIDTIVRDITRIIEEKGAGIYRYTWSKPESGGIHYPKLFFVKYFNPFDWYIGASIYLDDLEKTLQNDVVERIRNIRFGRDGEIIGFRRDGTIICHQDDRFTGRSIKDFIDEEGYNFGHEIFSIGISEQEQGFVSFGGSPYTGLKNSTRKLGFVKAYGQWDWVFVAVMSMDDMEQAIENERKTYLRINFENITLFITLFILAVSMMLLFAYFYSLRIRQGISLFTNFFRKAADEKIRIDSNHLSFTEFEDLSTLANQMVDDRIQKEMLIRRDELRLDTLLQLGTMEERCFQEKYDFILERIVRITRSEGGYIALINNSQTHLNLFSYYEVFNSSSNHGDKIAGISRSLEQAGLPGAAVLRGDAIVNNHVGQIENSYPYSNSIIRHIDVPIINNGNVVVVAGVYNNPALYDNTDTRQITMLLEGLWLHVLKVCAEEEMARLERQIIAVSEEERSTIGRDLHDDLGSHLSGVELLCMVLQKKLSQEVPEKAEELGAIRNLIREAIEITRRLAQGLYPVHVVEHGLESVCEELKIEVENLFELECELIIELQSELGDSSMAIHLYYIIREGVFNAARHGRPHNIRIRLLSRKNRLTLEMEDDGCGFSTEETQQGIGLHTMKYRAKAIGAQLSIASEKGRGTRIVLEGEF